MASVLLAYTTAIYAFDHVARLREGQHYSWRKNEERTIDIIVGDFSKSKEMHYIWALYAFLW